jgi:hypothetical protein
MKVNWAYLKKPSVIIGAVVLFFILLFLLNRNGGSASSGQTVVNTGPTDAQAAAQTQLALAQISAGLQGQAIQLDYAKSQDANDTQLALATIAAAAQNQSLAVQQEIANRTIDAQTHGLDLQYQTAVANNNFALDYAQQQFAYGIASQSITANTQMQMSADQLRALQMSTNASIVMGLAGRNKYSSIALPAYFGAQTSNPTASYSQVGTVS